MGRRVRPAVLKRAWSPSLQLAAAPHEWGLAASFTFLGNRTHGVGSYMCARYNPLMCVNPQIPWRPLWN